MKRIFLMLMAALVLFGGQIALAESTLDETTEVSKDAAELDHISRIYTFTLNGDTYTLPCQVTDFTENGWDLGSGTLDANTYARTIGFHNGGSEYVGFEVLNDTEEDGVELANLKVVSVNVTQSFVDVDGNEFVTADGLHPGMTVDEVKAIYGAPSGEHATYIAYHFQDRYETDGLRGLGVVYAGEDSLYAYREEGSDVVIRIGLQYFGIENGEGAE